MSIIVNGKALTRAEEREYCERESILMDCAVALRLELLRLSNIDEPYYFALNRTTRHALLNHCWPQEVNFSEHKVVGVPWFLDESVPDAKYQIRYGKMPRTRGLVTRRMSKAHRSAVLAAGAI